jgi:PadR family transcriptional regulator PadR
MTRAFRTTRPMRTLLETLAAGNGEWRYGYDLSRETGLKSGTLYPLLMRFSERGWVEARWAEAAAQGRPPRRMVRLSAEGRRSAGELAAGPARPRELKPA